MTQVIELDPNNAVALYNRGNAKFDLRSYESALSDYNRAIELDPDYAQAFCNRGVAKAVLHRYESAISDFNRFIELNPNNAIVFYYRGEAKAELHLYESAISDYDRAIELDPNNVINFSKRGFAKALLHCHESAISDFNMAIELDPNDAITFVNRGVAKAKLHRYKSAISDYDRAIELDPNHFMTFSNRGEANAKLHRHESAISDYDRTIELDPNNVITFSNRGLAKTNLRRYESAISDFDRAIEIDPEMSLPYFGKAVTFWKGFDELGTAHLHFNRFIFLAETEKIIEYWKKAHDFYARHAATPFLLHRLFELLPGIGEFVSWQGSLHETERQCRTLKNYLQHLRNTGEPERDAPQFHRLEALVHYFMGDPMEAYRIYDNILDGELECLDLMDSYYFLCSAAEFLEPGEGIRRFALQQAGDLISSARAEGDERELYYAGQLHALGDDWGMAFKAFGRAQAFFPATVMQAVAADRLGKPQAEVEAMWEKTKQLAAAQLPEAGINGFPEVWLELGREDYLAPFRQYAHFREIAEHLHSVREDGAPFHAADFWEIWRLSPADEQEIAWQVRKKELEKIEVELHSFFTQNLAQRYAGFTEEQLANLELVLAKKNKAAQGIFEKLRQEASSGSKALEHQLGLEIDHWELHSAHAYALMLKYFFLSGKLEDKPALLLYFYNDATAAQKQRDYAAAKEAYVEGSQPVFSLLVSTLLRLGDVASAVAAGALSVLTQQFFNQNRELLDETSHSLFFVPLMSSQLISL